MYTGTSFEEDSHNTWYENNSCLCKLAQKEDVQIAFEKPKLGKNVN